MKSDEIDVMCYINVISCAISVDLHFSQIIIYFRNK